MIAEVFIPGPLPGMNEILAAAKSGHGKGNAYSRMKKQWTETVWAMAKSAKLKNVPGPVVVHFSWWEPNRKRDVDNVSAAAKFCLDGLVKAGVIETDGQRTVSEVTHWFGLSTEKPGVRVRVETAPPPF